MRASTSESKPGAGAATAKSTNRTDKLATPEDQSNAENDRKITQEIRQAVMREDSLSFGAKNVKIITAKGRVTLRGAVKSEQERSAILAAARRVAGVMDVDDQMEVKP